MPVILKRPPLLRPAAAPPKPPKRPPPSRAFSTYLPVRGNTINPSIMVVVDPLVSDTESYTSPLSNRQFSQLAPFMKQADLNGSDMIFISACKTISTEISKSDKKLNIALKEDRAEFERVFAALKPRIVIPMGKAAARQVFDQAVKITKIRGLAKVDETLRVPVVPTLGISHVSRVPEHSDVLSADLRTVSEIIKNGFTIGTAKAPERLYKWVTDLSFLLKNKPKRIGLDIEASCYGANTFPHWYVPETKVLTVQIAYAPEKSVIFAIDYEHYQNPEGARDRLIFQLRELLEDPDIECVGQNLKYDISTLREKLNIKVANYKHDTLLLVHALNENLLNKGLDDLVRIYLPAYAGYKDHLTRKYGEEIYTHMQDVIDPHDMLAYGCPDADVVLQLSYILEEKLKEDPKNYNCYERVTMPAQRAFCIVEEQGLRINRKALSHLYNKIAIHQKAELDRIRGMIPASIVTRISNSGVGFKLTRPQLIREWLFTDPNGLKLPVRHYTKTGDISTSAKDHLTYFKDDYPQVKALVDYVKNDKLQNTYIGLDKHISDKGKLIDATGFWQYITAKGKIHPSYSLFGTVTGRTSSRDPNGQNFPKRGSEFVTEYRAIFEAPPGYCLIECDLSQIELRVVGMLANEPTFLHIYRTGGDIHCATAAVVMGITLEAFMALKKTDPDTFKLQRFRAKAVNFGFIYGMGWRKFRAYAKTDYNINYTEEEAEHIRKMFFAKYSNLTEWHRTVRDFVKEHGYVRALDGRVRHLPAVHSDDEVARSSAERQAVNSPVQGFASDLGLMAIARIVAEVDPKLLRVVGFVHDAIVCIAPVRRAQEACKTVKHYMETNPLKKWFNLTMAVPIVAEASVGLNLNSMWELDDKMLANDNLKTYADLHFHCATKAWYDKDEAKRGVKPVFDPRLGTVSLKRPGQRPIIENTQPKRKLILRKAA